MISSLQPSRPKFPSAQPVRSSQGQQQVRHLQNESGPSSGTAPTQQVHRPGSQIEAMPPTAYDPATRHPVFFTNGLQKPPFPVSTAGSTDRPVALGYVWDTGRLAGQAPREGQTKL
ncbi:hypothetical protein L228DRAFT_281860 [Xylona heveae TC161]|uniref:Uncharacterized protein n=1 Tax=Xylona heveae (strain CBS 132557 / TC161) TaxID=1328760 RepID=A0A161TBP6_XYLHT|nr:hypothetical protein L228DRAFT_281860 [Xylona heveae TC161]KZF23107.1 hypothetical protein L228DRAFT_281860 [Xylona heveae TC161]